MKALHIVYTGLLISTLFSCKEEKEKPKVIYDSTAKTKEMLANADTTEIEVADLPIEITGTDYMIYPVGDLRVEGSKPRYSGSGSGDVSYNISNYIEFEITGYLRNLKFQKIDSDSLTVLTDKPVLIQTATYLKSLADRTKQQFFIYTLADLDTNKDGKLDPSDIRTLYISDVSGNGFTKLSTDFEELIDWKMVESKNRLYFRTTEDTNKNGKFDKSDVIHYHYVDLSIKDWKVSDYNPI